MKVFFRRCHSNIWLPMNIKIMLNDFFNVLPEELGVTYHGCEQLLEDKNTIVPMPTKQDLLNPTNRLVEVHELISRKKIPKGILHKIVIKIMDFDDNFDFTYVVSRDGFIVSGWANSKSDKHTQLNIHNYYSPEGEE